MGEENSMKMTEEQKEKMKVAMAKRDWENVHGLYDDMIHKRLKELDEEFYLELGQAVNGATFWFA
jgi:hypothetical protein